MMVERRGRTAEAMFAHGLVNPEAERRVQAELVEPVQKGSRGRLGVTGVAVRFKAREEFVVPGEDDQGIGPALQRGQLLVHVFQVSPQVGPDVKVYLPAWPGLLELPGDDLADGDRWVVRVAHGARSADHDQRELVACRRGARKLGGQMWQPMDPG